MTRLRWLAVLTALGVLSNAWAQDPSTPVIPPTLPGELGQLTWLVERFGYLGLTAWLVWIARGAFARAGALAVPIVIQLHPEDRKRLTRIVRKLGELSEGNPRWFGQLADEMTNPMPDDPSESSEPEPRR